MSSKNLINKELEFTPTFGTQLVEYWVALFQGDGGSFTRERWIKFRIIFMQNK